MMGDLLFLVAGVLITIVLWFILGYLNGRF